MPATRPIRNRSARLALAAGAALGLLGAPVGGTLALQPTASPAEACFATDLEPTVGCQAAALPIEPDPTVTDAQPQAWDRIVVGADGTTLEVYFWMGVRHCNGLHSVRVAPTQTGIDLTLLTGVPAGAEGMVCIALATEYVTTVVLEAPLIAYGG